MPGAKVDLLHHAGFVLSCSLDGVIRQVVMDDLGRLSPEMVGRRLHALVRGNSADKVDQFFRELQTNGAALSWELDTAIKDSVETLHFFGVAKGEDVYVIVSYMAQSLFSLYDELIRMINEQSVMLREAQKEQAAARRDDPEQLESVMRLNNDLVNAQRKTLQLNHQLVRQETQLRTLINNSPDAQLVIDAVGYVIFFNPAAEELFSLQSETPSEFRLPLADIGDAPMQLCIPGPEPRQAEARSNHVVLHDENVRLISLRDVTEQLRLESIRQDMENISRHDLKSPLSGIVGLARTMQSDASLKEEQRRIFGMIADSGENVLEQVNRTLDLYKMETGAYELQPEPVDLAAIVRDKLQRSPKRPNGNGVTLTVDGETADDASFTVDGDPMLLRMLMDNLVNNALDAAGDRPVAVTMDGAKRTVVVWNALPVPKEIRNVFFEKYVTQGKRFGTGLGTYSARLIARAHDADISMETSERDGTAIRLVFPG